ncbi:17094_t:CDS:2, partial [Racocetra fulgida]
GRDSSIDIYKPKDYFNYSNIHKTQWRTDIEELRHLKDDYGSSVDICEPNILIVVEEPPYLDMLENKFDQLEMYDKRLQATDIELPCLNE